ncbi:MAG TPA: Rieske 2Fe-2S domain-containing protein [Polyangiaceae bacterium LLY-WYZ-15_(1-7)]|nr:hypothetical protein [Myxococcales bacterium]MAT29963.1 hypothetical protein [Sandaracinus sp.]HJK90723.1 Rieske 2Fe-2S domain-containing protein [Polyangiaceae bacterium LLY-WYZ-15_(1-7)]MBJ71517.1 hypothetical protein [Sandaracinus sp.]HJL00889.1 Rieske 2Fe-2S domain-containing protein [Polyangiaceae bacterium LLY-WYZ-15_(1-7)]
MPDGARSMTALPEGVTRHGDALHIDLKVRTELLEKGGVLELKAFRLLLVRSRKRVRAFCATCPHKPKKLYRVHRVRKAAVPLFRCPKHDWTWDHKGRPRGKAKKKLPRARTELLGETLVVQLPENATAPPKKKKRKKNAER